MKKTFTFNSYTIAELVKQGFVPEMLIYKGRCKAGWKTHFDKKVFNSGKCSWSADDLDPLYRQLAEEVCNESWWTGKTTEPVSCVWTYNRKDGELSLNNFDIVAVYGKNRIATLPRDLADWMLEHQDYNYIERFFETIENGHEIRNAAKNERLILSEMV